MPDFLLIALVLAAALFILSAFSAVRALAKARMLAGTTRLSVSLLLLVIAMISGVAIVGTHGYHALTREEIAAVVKTKPLGEQMFQASFEFPDGSDSAFTLRGDELYVDARIVKWTPFANLLGLHTAYELDRVAGRYTDLEDERDKERTVFSLATERPVDVFVLRKKFPQLKPVLDAEYGSGTFIAASEPATFEVRVSTTGLLLRPISSD